MCSTMCKRHNLFIFIFSYFNYAETLFAATCFHIFTIHLFELFPVGRTRSAHRVDVPQSYAAFKVQFITEEHIKVSVTFVYFSTKKLVAKNVPNIFGSLMKILM